ncbi:MAG TPA: hypothetical protein VM364_18625 [Vicinamibacterales bacterium]|nr:hypothetical protein [Vicinamibacterales bacterium]HWI18868.1 hypothetical protein [Vicinamibacterales bacterium]
MLTDLTAPEHKLRMIHEWQEVVLFYFDEIGKWPYDPDLDPELLELLLDALLLTRNGLDALSKFASAVSFMLDWRGEYRQLWPHEKQMQRKAERLWWACYWTEQRMPKPPEGTKE